mmetsp:Transcript_11760/g.30019  ORF Transcript_11760/g.30019 Transcript_11760/m.30019 type:complete len:262 (-) Transcript_11760:53-838(-)
MPSMSPKVGSLKSVVSMAGFKWRTLAAKSEKHATNVPLKCSPGKCAFVASRLRTIWNTEDRFSSDGFPSTLANTVFSRSGIKSEMVSSGCPVECSPLGGNERDFHGSKGGSTVLHMPSNLDTERRLKRLISSTSSSLLFSVPPKTGSSELRYLASTRTDSKSGRLAWDPSLSLSRCSSRSKAQARTGMSMTAWTSVTQRLQFTMAITMGSRCFPTRSQGLSASALIVVGKEEHKASEWYITNQSPWSLVNENRLVHTSSLE